MKLVVCIKWVPDPEFPLQATAGGIRLDTPGLTYMASPVDMVACEAAVRLKETAGGTVSLFTAGPDAADAGLRSGLALGADDATRVEFPAGGFSGGTRAGSVLAAAIAREAPDVIVCGSRSSDSGSGAVPATIAERLGMPLVTNVVSVRGQGPLEVERRLEGGRRQVLRVELPVVIGVEETLCDPRYPSVLARSKAGRATIAVQAQSEAELPQSAVTLVGLQGPRPLAARLVAPVAGLPARERLAFILAGGPDQGRVSSRLEGPISEITGQLLAFLTANGVAGNRNGGQGS